MLFASTSISYMLPSHLTVIAWIGCGLRKEKVGNDRNGRSEKKEDMDRKDRSKKEKFGQMHFRPFIPVQSSYRTLEVPGHTKSQPAQHRKSLGLTSR